MIAATMQHARRLIDTARIYASYAAEMVYSSSWYVWMFGTTSAPTTRRMLARPILRRSLIHGSTGKAKVEAVNSNANPRDFDPNRDEPDPDSIEGMEPHDSECENSDDGHFNLVGYEESSDESASVETETRLIREN